MLYGCQIWGQCVNPYIKRIIKLQDRAIRVINFADYHHPTHKLYQHSKVLKLQDHVTLLNYLHINDSLSDSLPKSLCNRYRIVQLSHSHQATNAVINCVTLPKSRTLYYGIHSISGQACRNYNFIQINCNSNSIHLKSRGLKKDIITKFFLTSYFQNKD